MANVAEGHGRRSRKEFHQFLVVALDSAYVDNAEFECLYSMADEVGRLCEGLRKTVTRQTKRSFDAPEP